MNKNQIRGLLIAKEGSIRAAAKRIRKSESQVSATINYLRLNLEVRRLLIKQYGIRFSPYIKPSYSWRPASPKGKPRRANKLQEVNQ